MLILAVDTTTFAGSVALLNNRRLIGEINIDSDLTYSERLLPAVNFLLDSNNIDIKNISGYALAVGPGSFTGIRIGISAIKSFSYASGKQVACVSSLKALALKLKLYHSHLVCPVLDAKKGEIYGALFESTERKLKEIVKQGAFTPDYFFSLLPSKRIISFIGNGIEAYRETAIKYFKDKARFPLRSVFIANEVGQLGYEILKKKKGVLFHEVKPLYFRKSQAEEKN
ncbi:MAG: tRNA (adenosine(37)-N6)-threonylcarbamoyltransferase complex dimerization subunit type 1 TsaB [Candidatus Aminicenantaceae bacterium]